MHKPQISFIEKNNVTCYHNLLESFTGKNKENKQYQKKKLALGQNYAEYKHKNATDAL